MYYNRFIGVRKKVSILTIAVVFLLSSLASAIVPMLMSQFARAATEGVVINEINTKGGSDWVEIYNNGPSTIGQGNLKDYKVTDSDGNEWTLPQQNLGSGDYLVIETSNRFNDDGDTVTLFDKQGDAIDTVTYGGAGHTPPEESQTLGRYANGTGVFQALAPTKGHENELPSAVTTPKLNAENFNAVDGNYKGISVGFNAKDFGTVTAVSVEVERADGTTVTKHGNQGVFDIISGKTTAQQLTAPFVIQEGTFTEAGDTHYWNPAPATWNTNTAPVKATINVTDESGTETVVNTGFNEGAPSWPSYFSLLGTPSCTTDNTTFDTFSLGNINGQNGWGSTGPYDQAIVNNIYGYSTFGCKSLRLSNAVTTGAFGDQTFSYSTTDEAGEADSTNGGKSGGTRQNHYEAQFDIASAQSTEQSGLAISVSPDRGDGSRMSYLGFADTAGGVAVTFYDVQGASNPANFVPTSLDTLSRTVPHTVKFVIDYADGPSNDVVEIYIDGSLVHTGTTWENYYRYDSGANAEQTPRTSDSLIFRAGGTAASATSGKGFLFDNVNISTSTIATDTTKPNVNVVSPAHDSLLDTGTFTVEGTASDNETSVDEVKYTITRIDGIGGNYVASVGSGVATGTTAWEFDVNGLTDGFYRLKVQAFDGAGNWKYDYHDVEVDTTAPAQPQVLGVYKGHSNPSPASFIPCGGFTNTTEIRIVWDENTESDLSHYWFGTRLNDHHRKVTGKTYYNGDMNPAKAPFYYTVIAVDKAGNESMISDQCHVTLDTETPDVPTQVSPGDNVPVQGNGLVHDWQDVADAARYVYQSYNVDSSGNCDLGDIRWTQNYTASETNSRDVADLVFCWRVKAVDAAGNESAWSPAWKTIVDNTKPDAQVVTPTNGTVLSGGTFTVEGTASDNETSVTEVLYTVTQIDGIGGNYIASIDSGTGTGTNAWNFDVTGLDDGFYRLKVQAFDAAGNWKYHYHDVEVDTSTASTVDNPGSSNGPQEVLGSSNNEDTPNQFGVTTFNSSSPRSLDPTSDSDEDDNGTGQVKSDTTETDEPKQEKEIVASTSSGFGWYWIALILALAAAAYYAYRNWRLAKNQ